MLYEVFNAVSLTAYDYYKHHNRKMFDMVLDAADKLARDLMFPVLHEMDRNPPELKDGTVKVHPSVKRLMKECGDGGWISASFPFEHEGEQLPHLIYSATHFIFSAANYSASIFPELTAGAARLITSFGTRDQIQTYVPKMLAGEWQGTMALTEPQAGSSLADMTSAASPQEDGTYRIKGHKIFISSGDNDCVDNIIHLMLAKIEGAPPGVKGISMFIVPKKRLNADGSLIPNDITVSAVYHKLGYRGCPLTELAIGESNDCTGYLVGEPHKGLIYMFQLMNEARIGVGLGAASIATAAYYASLEYARARPQGRPLGKKDLLSPQVPIIEHADVKRMLLFQRAVTEGALGILMQCSFYSDLESVQTGEDRKNTQQLLELLTPVAKTYPSEMGILSTSAGLQCFGGYGYCDDFPLEQYYRDVRIHPIHEGTTGIQAMDLLGRKIVMENGKAFALFSREVRATCAVAEEENELKPYALKMTRAMENLEDTTHTLAQIAGEKGIEVYLADAALYLEYFSIIAVAWQWLRQAISALKALQEKCTDADKRFYTGKLFTFKFFYEYELPKIQGLGIRLKKGDGLTVEMKPAYFDD